MARHLCSDRDRGILVSIDGPGGAGKSTTVQHLTHILTAAGETVHVTAEPTTGPIGSVARNLTATVTGRALACLYAADRYRHVETEIRPKLAAGTTVIVDRYIASGLVVQRFDGVDLEFLWRINSDVARPDLSVILIADPSVITKRLDRRGRHNRFQHRPDSTQAEIHFYGQACERLKRAGFNILEVDCARPAADVARCIGDRLTRIFGTTEEN